MDYINAKEAEDKAKKTCCKNENCVYCKYICKITQRRLLDRESNRKCCLCNRKFDFPSCVVDHIKKYHFPHI